MLMEFGLNALTVWAVCLIKMTLKTLNQQTITETLLREHDRIL